MQTSESGARTADRGDAVRWRASFPMYDFAWLSEAHDVLWSEIAGALVRRGWTDVPIALHHQDDVHGLWHEQELLISQSCGWPLVDELEGKVATIGAFEYDIVSADGPTYRSPMMMRAGSTRPTSGQLPALTAAVNSLASLSGWVSLVHAYPELNGVWRGPLHQTGSHAGSAVAVRDGVADLAMIDAVSLAQFRVGRPDLVEGLVVVGEGPRVPCLPIIGPLSFTSSQIADVRSSIAEALASRRGIDAAKPLLIRAFHVRDYSDYAPVQALASRAN